MGSDTPLPPILSRRALRAVNITAWQLIGKYGFTYSDLEDLRQDLLLDLLERLPDFDASRSRENTFVERVIRNKVASLVRFRKAKCRDYRQRIESLDAKTQDEDGRRIDLSQAISVEDYLRLVGQLGRPVEEARELDIDLRRALLSLPPDLQDVAIRLTFQTVTEIARDLGVHRDTVYERIGRLRVAFEKAGLGAYL